MKNGKATRQSNYSMPIAVYIKAVSVAGGARCNCRLWKPITVVLVPQTCFGVDGLFATVPIVERMGYTIASRTEHNVNAQACGWMAGLTV